MTTTFDTRLQGDDAKYMLFRAMDVGRQLVAAGGPDEGNDRMLLRFLGVDGDEPVTRSLADRAFVTPSVAWAFEQAGYVPSSVDEGRTVAKVAMMAMSLGLSTGRAVERVLMERADGT